MRRLAAVPRSPDAGPVMEDMVARGAATPRVSIFDWQSYLSTTLQEQAIMAMPISQDRIIPSTLNTEQTRGIGFALSPSSECPVAVLPNQDRGGSSGAAVVLKPGQVYYPGGEFVSFRWGLPYGWLGGGLAQLFVLCEKTADLYWTNDAEVLFHRMTLPLQANTGNPATLAPNWPLRFPWPNCYDLNARLQGDQPTIVVQPSKIRLRLRATTIASPNQLTLRMLMSQTQDYDFTSSPIGTALPTAAGAFIDTTWPSFAQSGFQVGGAVTVEWPEQTFTGGDLRLGGDSAIMTLIDVNNTLAGGETSYFVDVLRYGKIGG